DGSLVALLLFARETFTAELTELVVYDSVDPGTAYVTTVGPGAQRAAMIACDRADVDGRLARANVVLGSTMVAPFSGASGVSGAVLVADTLASGRTFKRDEERLLRTFAGQLATTLEKAQINASLAKARVQKNEFAHQASHDALTGLANRSRFRQCLADGLPAAAAAGTGLAALFIDLDDFKTVNDTMGHAAGDELLRVVAQRISASIGANDVAARLGGDEFAVLLVDVDNDSDVQVVAERILVVLGDPIEIDGTRVIANASIGAAMHTAGEDADALMQNADIAMYTAKRNGKGRCDFFEPSLSFSGTRRRLVESGLQRALEAGELVLHYQPVVDVAKNQIVAIEALVRWCDPSRGLVPPAEFIRVAEETSLIVPIGRFVLREACQQAKAWETLAPEMRMFVNLSARELNEPDLADHVARVLAETGLEPSRLILEVTDAAVMQNMGAARRTLNALKHLGVGLGLDDVGPGYAALQHLRHLPIDVLKIAKPWIDALGNTEADVTAVRELVELGHAVGLHVVAEGVERVDQAAELIDMGCEWAQGYYYARSLESEAIGTLLCRANARAGARRETKEQTELELAE
ncbi:MAG TPA: EAL domain-containing protein, partial [Acidimicrobiia bacterium]|nr:EAL domain-containing protein [Acidimicrobiia bacterium]